MRVGGGVKGLMTVLMLPFIGDDGEWSDASASVIDRAVSVQILEMVETVVH